MVAVAISFGDFIETKVARRLSELLVACGLFQDVRVGSHFIFGDDSRRRLGVGHLLTEGADRFPTERFCGAPTPLPRHQLVSVRGLRLARLGLWWRIRPSPHGR